MRKLILVGILIFVSNFLSQNVFADKFTGKFKRAVMFSGQGMDIATYLGALEGLQIENKKPDLIMAEDWGALAAALVHILPGPVEAKEWIQSRHFYNFLKNLDRRDVFHLKQGFEGVPFNSSPEKIRILIMATSIKNGRQKQAYLSDIATAFAFHGLKITSEYDLFNAIRFSISDTPLQGKDNRAWMKAKDSYPLKLAEELAEQVYSVFPGYDLDAPSNTTWMYLDGGYTSIDTKLSVDVLNFSVQTRMNIPETYEQYREITESQYTVGRVRAIAAAGGLGRSDIYPLEGILRFAIRAFLHSTY